MAEKYWTEARKQQLTELWAAGLTATEIAEEMGGFESKKDRGRNAILGKVHRLKLPQRRESISAEEAARRLAGRRARDVARREYQRKVAKILSTPKVGTTVLEIETAPEETSGAILFEDLLRFSDTGRNQCRYPIGHQPPYLFCGNRTSKDGESYCLHHYLLTHGREREISDDERDRRMQRGYRSSGRHITPSALRCYDDATDVLGSSSS